MQMTRRLRQLNDRVDEDVIKQMMLDWITKVASQYDMDPVLNLVAAAKPGTVLWETLPTNYERDA
jgi:hypothetical protein